MAVGDIRLSTNRYVRPDAYIGRVHQPRPAALTANPRFPAFVGRGNRLAREANSKHIRSRVYAESLNFSTTQPYVAPLDFDASNDQSLAVLQKNTGEPVPFVNWMFTESVTGSGSYDRVQIDATVFDNNTTYQIEYQSVERTVEDVLQFDDIREIITVGDAEGSNKYVEFEDYRVKTLLTGDATDTDALAVSSQTNTTGSVSALVKTGAAGSGTITFNAANTYTYPYSRSYTLTCTDPAVPGASPNFPGEFTLEISAISGGNSQETNIPYHSSATRVVTLQINQNGVASDVTNVLLLNPATWNPLAPSARYKATEELLDWYGTADGIRLNFVFGATGFVAGDSWTWDAYGPGLMEFSSAHQNTNQFSSVATPVEVGNLAPATSFTSGGLITVNGETNYDDDFDRTYTMTVFGPAGIPGARQCDIHWTGYNELPFSEGTISLDEALPATLTQQLVERDIYLDFTFGTFHALADTTNATTAASALTISTALALAADVKAVYNLHDSDGGGAWHGGFGISTHQITTTDLIDLATLRTFCLEVQTDVAAHFADLTMHTVADTVHALNTAYTVTATSPLATLVNFLNDVKTKYDKHRVSIGLVLDDYWTMTASAARREYTAKDDRNYQITLGTVVPGTSIPATYNARNREGGWGTVTLTGDGVSYYADPYFDLPDNIRLMARNVNTLETLVANDVYTFSATSEDVVDWTLVRRGTETIAAADIQQDVSGNVTGVPLSYFLILNETPSSILRVKASASGTHLSYVQVTSTPYIYFATDPGVAVQVDYEWQGYEPSPGNPYFITANRKRADTEFNEALRYLTIDDARLGLYPSATSNHLWIMAEIAFETSFFGGYFIQAKSAADNEVYSIADYRNAIDASEAKSEISDLVVLSYFNALAYAKLSVEQMNDPFVGKQRLLWVGTPIGTAVGDDTTPGTLVYLARNTLQFSPQSQGKGNVILISNNQCTRTQALEDGTTTTLTLDGSFLAGHAAALTASFTDPADTILKRETAAFDTITLFSERETEILGGASTVYMNLKGAGLYEYGESITVDTTEVALNEISARTQEHHVLKTVRSEMADALIGFVPPSPAAGVLIIQGQLVLSLGGMASKGVIAPYGSEVNPPTIRPISPSTDVYVFVDELDQRLYHFGYFFNTRLPIKRLFGLYSVNTRFWDNRSLS